MGWLEGIAGLFRGRAEASIIRPVESHEEIPISSTRPDIFSARALASCGVRMENAQKYIAHLNAAAAEFDIVTTRRAASFLAQVLHESDYFQYVEELWGPTPAQERYEARADLGNTEPGDGFRYRGHGFIQITGRANHHEVATYFGVPMWKIVEWLKSPEGACRSAGWFWMKRGCNELADVSDLLGITRRINGGTNGLEHRRELYVRALTALMRGA